ncbi:hypothetical protein Kpol_224p3 [Vanderwaltozyma polyspora DSM 70294]|uniref:Cytochrome c oxidase assembly factor 6 n=1 Tax=Vanderwaltozyma polyspora (strain ATCC 22028 / DSM 70294 / BCRC 21397 / CBS 2163 / NBRC 10782 / NRRL Y-8283 / UCD 57-17) TaxID=436907 RepID=A7TTG3_VANPO|nr:uncharacterized protein Kpol_224p3 [Vanderwaltozyma polyspora DSM 70294]EDO14445.1 hypothetical protein Kpol_224p3 [Vanderwaltozyma polyspora DSM 70294]
MGLLNWFSGNGDDDAPVANRQQREQCWESRDLFFKCLDNVDIIDANDKKNKDIIKKNCNIEESNFEKDCAKSWISYFKDKRISDYKKLKFKEEMDKIGAQPINLSPQEFSGMKK